MQKVCPMTNVYQFIQFMLCAVRCRDEGISHMSYFNTYNVNISCLTTPQNVSSYST